MPHLVLNARYHEQEANIIAQAGVPGTVTIATNMAGRGTDIQLGGNDRYRVRDWMKEELEAGRLAAVHGEGDDQELLRKWIDDILYLGDDWIETRLNRGSRSRLRMRAKAQAAGEPEPSAREASPRSAGRSKATGAARREAQRDRQGVCGQRQGWSGGPTATTRRPISTGSTPDLRDEARDWLKDSGRAWSFGAINENLVPVHA